MTITKQDLIDEGCDPEHIDDWFTIRKAKKKPLTETALKFMRTEAGKAGLTLPQAVQKCAEEGWLGFKALYIKTPVKMTALAPQTDREAVSKGLRNIHDTNW